MHVYRLIPVNKLMPILAMILMVLPAFSNDKLSEQNVAIFVKAVQESVVKQDVDQFISYFKSDAKIKMILPEYMGGTIDTSVTDYRAMLAISWGMSAEFTYDIKDVLIDVAADGQTATVKETVNETMALDGEIMTSTTSKQMTQLVLISGNPKIASLEAKITLLKID